MVTVLLVLIAGNVFGPQLFLASPALAVTKMTDRSFGSSKIRSISDTPILGLSITSTLKSPKVNVPTPFVAVTLGGTQPITYAWRVDNVLSGAGITFTHTFTAAKPYIVAVIATNSAGSVTATRVVTAELWQAYMPLLIKAPPSTAPPTFAPHAADVRIRALVNTGNTRSFYVYDVDSPLESLQLFVKSSNQAILPDANVQVAVGDVDTNRQRVRFSTTFTPTQIGDTQFQLTARDSSGAQNSDAYPLTVVATNLTPTISAIADQTTPNNTPITVDFTVNDADGDPISIYGEVSSPNVTFSFGGSGAHRTMTLTPTLSSFESVSVWIYADDGIASEIRGFGLRVPLPTSTPPTFVDSVGAPLPTTLRALVGTKKWNTFSVHDPDSPLASLQVVVTSSNQTVLPNSGIVILLPYLLSPSTQSIYVDGNFTPIQAGDTQLVLWTRDDSGAEGMHIYNVSVVATNAMPTISEIADQTTQRNVPITVHFTVNDADGDPISLGNNISASSNIAYSFGGSGANRTMTLTPTLESSTAGENISVFVDDGITRSEEYFNLVTTP